jgi:hypothetical protein
MIDRLDRIISSLSALHAEADAVIDEYIVFVRQRDGLGGTPIPNLRLTHIEGRSGLSLDLRRALSLARADLEGTKAPPANDGPSAASEFHLDSGVTANLNLREAARQLNQRRKSHE